MSQFMFATIWADGKKFCLSYDLNLGKKQKQPKDRDIIKAKNYKHLIEQIPLVNKPDVDRYKIE